MDHKTHIENIVFDDDAREYYNTSTDIFLSEEEAVELGLKSYDKIVTPLPTSSPDYFKAIKNDNTR